MTFPSEPPAHQPPRSTTRRLSPCRKRPRALLRCLLANPLHSYCLQSCIWAPGRPLGPATACYSLGPAPEQGSAAGPSSRSQTRPPFDRARRRRFCPKPAATKRGVRPAGGLSSPLRVTPAGAEASRLCIVRSPKASMATFESRATALSTGPSLWWSERGRGRSIGAILSWGNDRLQDRRSPQFFCRARQKNRPPRRPRPRARRAEARPGPGRFPMRYLHRSTNPNGGNINALRQKISVQRTTINHRRI